MNADGRQLVQTPSTIPASESACTTERSQRNNRGPFCAFLPDQCVAILPTGRERPHNERSGECHGPASSGVRARRQRRDRVQAALRESEGPPGLRWVVIEQDNAGQNGGDALADARANHEGT